MAKNVTRRLRYLTKALGEFDTVVVATATPIVHDALLGQVSKDTGGDRRMSGVRSKSALDVTVTKLSNPAGVRMQPVKRQYGLWVILDRGAAAHEINARPRRKHRSKLSKSSSRGKAMRIGNAWRAGPWRVSGSRGKATWAKGVEAGLDDSMTTISKKFSEVVNSDG